MFITYRTFTYVKDGAFPFVDYFECVERFVSCANNDARDVIYKMNIKTV